MANIEISNLHPAGSELLSDLESFMDELDIEKATDIKGGLILFSALSPLFKGCQA